MRSSFVFVPSGGLANRMRAIASAYSLATKTNRTAEIIWFNDFGCRIRFENLFLPIKNEEIRVRESTYLDKITTDRARPKNLYLTRVFQHLVFDGIIEEHDFAEFDKTGFDFVGWLAKKRRPYISSFSRFCPDNNEFRENIRMLFVPVGPVMEKVLENKSRFTPSTFGLHIRRTDHVESIIHSTDEKFIDIINLTLEKVPDASFFLATDDDEVKSKFRMLFPGKIITSTSTVSRESESGMRDAAAELWTLASTKAIYGSYNSSYSEMAAVIGGVDLITV